MRIEIGSKEGGGETWKTGLDAAASIGSAQTGTSTKAVTTKPAQEKQLCHRQLCHQEIGQNTFLSIALWPEKPCPEELKDDLT